MKLVLDTNIYCDYAEGLPHAVDILATRGDDIYLSSIVLGELTYGFMKGSRQQFNERKLQEIINKLAITNCDIQIWRALRIRGNVLKENGTTVKRTDRWVAILESKTVNNTIRCHFHTADRVITIDNSSIGIGIPVA